MAHPNQEMQDLEVEVSESFYWTSDFGEIITWGHTEFCSNSEPTTGRKTFWFLKNEFCKLFIVIVCLPLSAVTGLII